MHMASLLYFTTVTDDMTFYRQHDTLHTLKFGSDVTYMKTNMVLALAPTRITTQQIFV